MDTIDVLGNMLPVIHYYGDGSYDCPHCNYPVRADEGLGPCKNPWCIANPAMPVESAKQILVDRAKRQREESERKRNHELAMERIGEYKRTSDAKCTAKLTLAREQGFCIRCLVKSSFRKEVRHRKACPLAD